MSLTSPGRGHCRRIKQGWALSGDRPAQVPEGSGLSASGPAPGKGPQPQYLRLPIDSARKLRWYDREDLSRLIESNLQERQQLAEVNTALREVILLADCTTGPALPGCPSQAAQCMAYLASDRHCSGDFVP